jgi:hypothetical protein
MTSPPGGLQGNASQAAPVVLDAERAARLLAVQDERRLRGCGPRVQWDDNSRSARGLTVYVTSTIYRFYVSSE